MDYLARESADLSVELWNRIDDTVIGTARKQLSCRRFLKVFGPLGPGATTVAVDGVGKEEVLEDGIGRIVGRTQLELPLLYEDFTLLGRDLELAAQTGLPVDLSAAIAAAKKAARREDDLVLNGNKALGVDGLLTVKGSAKVKKGDWKTGENGFSDVAAAVSQLAKTGYLGRYALVVAPDLFLDLQRLQPSTGMLEIDRIQKLIGDNVFMTSALAPGKAVLVCAEPEYVDLAVGLDLSVGYLELADFNHTFRIMETAALRHRRVRVTRDSCQNPTTFGRVLTLSGQGNRPLVPLQKRIGWRSKSARRAVVPEIRGIAKAKRTSVRELLGSREDRVPRPFAASAGSDGRQAAGTPRGANRQVVGYKNAGGLPISGRSGRFL